MTRLDGGERRPFTSLTASVCVRENITNTTPAGAGIGASKATVTYNMNCRIKWSDDTNSRTAALHAVKRAECFIQSQGQH